MDRVNAHFHRRYGRWALITGAAQGLGEAFARQCARSGLDLVLVDRQAERLREVARAVAGAHGATVRPVVADLAREDALEVLRPETDGLDVGLLVSNAALSHIGGFLDFDRGDLLAELEVNARTPLLLAHHYGAEMARRRRGGMIFLSSLSAVTSTGYVAHYAATKAYNRALGEGLWYELRPHGVDVLAVLPGMTGTPAWYASGPRPSPTLSVMPPGQVVREALAALGRGPCLIPGRGNRLAALVMGRLFPRPFGIRLVSRSMEQIFGVRR